MSSIPTSCVDCIHHRVEPDPDPDDWFNHDDVRVICTRTAKNASRILTVACRPYRTRQETTPAPDWCPLRRDKSE